MYGQATPHCLYNSPAYNEELFIYIYEKEGGREGGWVGGWVGGSERATGSSFGLSFREKKFMPFPLLSEWV